jgi:hypothetical protein
MMPQYVHNAFKTSTQHLVRTRIHRNTNNKRTPRLLNAHSRGMHWIIRIRRQKRKMLCDRAFVPDWENAALVLNHARQLIDRWSLWQIIHKSKQYNLDSQSVDFGRHVFAQRTPYMDARLLKFRLAFIFEFRSRYFT